MSLYRLQQRHLERAYQRRIYADLRRISNQFAPRFAAAKDAADFDAVMQNYFEETRLADVQIEVVRSRKLRRRAWRYGIEAPPDAWDYDDLSGHRYLSPAGRRQLHQEVRNERMAAVRQWAAVLVPILAILIGLVGVLIGLVAEWRR